MLIYFFFLSTNTRNICTVSNQIIVVLVSRIVYVRGCASGLVSSVRRALAERSWVQIPARYSGWPGHYNNVGFSARLEISFELNMLPSVNKVTLLYFTLLYGSWSQNIKVHIIACSILLRCVVQNVGLSLNTIQMTSPVRGAVNRSQEITGRGGWNGHFQTN